MRLFSLVLCALALSPGLLVAQDALTGRFTDGATRAQITDSVKQILRDEANYTTEVRPDLFEVYFDDAECLEFFDEMADATVGTCLLRAGGWQMFSVFAVTFPYDVDEGFAVHPLTIVIE